MSFIFSQFNFICDTEIAQKACALFKDEIRLRTVDFCFEGGTIFEFKTLSETDLVAWVISRAHKEGKNISRQNAELLVSIS